jgi:hypothetical protein
MRMSGNLAGLAFLSREPEWRAIHLGIGGLEAAILWALAATAIGFATVALGLAAYERRVWVERISNEGIGQRLLSGKSLP